MTMNFFFFSKCCCVLGRCLLMGAINVDMMHRWPHICLLGPPMPGESSEAQAISRSEWQYFSEASSNQLYGQLFVIHIIHISTYCLTQQQENNLQQSASSAPSEGILSSSKYLSYSSIINNNFQSYSQPEIIVWQPWDYSEVTHCQFNF